jgi:hypothetical protein
LRKLPGIAGPQKVSGKTKELLAFQAYRVQPLEPLAKLLVKSKRQSRLTAAR